MEELYLVKPSAAYADQIAAYHAEFLERGDSLDGTSSLDRYSNVGDWLVWVEELSLPETCPEGFVVSTQWLCVRSADDKVVGMVNLRHDLNDHLLKIGGHIGYSTRPDERGKGYAKAMLGLCLPEAAKVELNRVLVTCNKDNEASRRTILAHGGVLENEIWEEDEQRFVQRYWIDLK